MNEWTPTEEALIAATLGLMTGFILATLIEHHETYCAGPDPPTVPGEDACGMSVRTRSTFLLIQIQ